MCDAYVDYYSVPWADFSAAGNYKKQDQADASFIWAGSGASAGEAMACADMNVDGYADMITSSPTIDHRKGAVMIQMGAPEGHYELGHSLYNADWALLGSEDGQLVGLSMIAGMNINGDKMASDEPIPDLLVSTMGRSDSGAEALLLHGPFTDFGSIYDWYSATAVFHEPSNVEGLNLGAAGDINDDGLDDLWKSELPQIEAVFRGRLFAIGRRYLANAASFRRLHRIISAEPMDSPARRSGCGT